MQRKKKAKKAGAKLSLGLIDRKLDKILKNQAVLLGQEMKIEKEEFLEEKEEKILEKKEGEELGELKKLEEIEKQVEKELKVHPLSRITLKDVAKGAVGAFAGLLVHYTFTYGLKTAEQIDVMRAALLFPLSFIIGVLFLYFTGFRKVKDPQLMKFLPVRVFVLYGISIVISVLVLLLFYPAFGADPVLTFKQLASLSISAVVGACTADLVGND